MYIGNNLKSSNQTPTTIETLGRSLEGEGYSLYYASSKNNKLLRLADMVLTCIRYRKKVDCVLIDTYSTWNFYYALFTSLTCRLLKTPYICILHGGNLENRLKNSKYLSAQVFKHALKLVAPSNFLKTIFKEYGYNEVVFIPNALPIHNYTFKKREEIHPRLLWVRSFSKIYNPLMAIEVVSILKKKYEEVSLCMIGPDKDGAMDETKKYAREKNVEVSFTGKLSKKDWTERAADYDIFINTTNVDNTPVSVMEAMALGLPVVSTSVGGIPFLVSDGDDGLLVPVKDAQAMASAILKLVENHQMASDIALNARKKVASFNWDEVKKDWFKILGDAI